MTTSSQAEMITLMDVAEATGLPMKTVRALCGPLRDPIEHPFAFQTVWSFLAVHELGAFEFIQDPVGGLADENEQARELAGRMGCKALPRGEVAGVGMVWAVPPMVLERLFPVNP